MFLQFGQSMIQAPRVRPSRTGGRQRTNLAVLQPPVRLRLHPRLRLVPLFFLILLTLHVSCANTQETLTPEHFTPSRNAKYVFLFIGDGMGPVHVGAAHPAFTDFPVSGSVSTKDISGGVPDSAAAATAIATGHKTSSGTLAMDSTGLRTYRSIAYRAHDSGWKVGILSTVSLNHATPAAFYASSRTRSDYYGIGNQMPESGFEYFAGGGLLSRKGTGGERPDLVEKLRDSGYRIISTRAGFLATTPGPDRNFVMNEKLDASETMPYDIERSAGDPELADFVTKGIELLGSETGFFMMVEGGKIDPASHENMTARVIGEIRALDRAVDVARRFAALHPGDTLILVTADHETGGMRLGSGGVSWTTTGHTGVRVPLYALGSGEEIFSGDYDNTGIFYRLVAVMGL